LISKEDIENEAIAIDKLRAERPAANIVQIFRHGWLTSYTRGGIALPVYFVDMELGTESLKDYINTRFNTESAHPDLLEIWSIMQQIAAGVLFIHQKGMIHRDLKPANSIAQSPNRLKRL
jgi:serine/threonine protein kinase